MTVFPRDNHHILINVKTILICSFMRFYISKAITLKLEALLYKHFMAQYASELICMSNICATGQPTTVMLTHWLSSVLCCIRTWIWSCHMLLSLRIKSDPLWWLRPVSSQLTFKRLKWIWWPDFCSDHLHSAKTRQGAGVPSMILHFIYIPPQTFRPIQEPNINFPQTYVMSLFRLA